jgi:exodeoxyribonuclease VII small subunit
MSKAKRKANQDSGDAEGAGDSLSFEGALERLEETVSRLESGEMPLEEALELFESGVALSRRCSATLEAAERRIEILIADRSDASGAESSEAFDFEEDPEEFED